MPTAWPVSLPQYSLSKEITASMQDITVTSETAQGREQSRKRVSKPMRYYSVTVAPLDDTQLATLDEFFNTTCGGGAAEFEWYRPDKPSTTATMKFVGGSLSVSPFGGMTTLWRASFQVKVFPT